MTIAVLVCFSAVALPCAPATVHAQSRPPALDPSVVSARSAMQSERDAAIALYVIGAVSIGGGVITSGAAVLVLGNCSPSLPSGRCASDDGATAAFYAGIGLGALGLVLLAIAIGLDVDAHSRRAALDTRAASLRPWLPSVGPTGGALGLTLAF
jgi:hypothetical protein